MISDSAFVLFSPAFLLSLIAGLSTGLGALVVVVLGIPKSSTVGAYLAFAAGVMLRLSLMDMFPEAAVHLGWTTASLMALGGWVLFMLLTVLVPEVDGERILATFITSNEASSTSSSSTSPTPAPQQSALVRTSVLIFTGLSVHNAAEGIAVYISASQGLAVGLRLAFAIACHNIGEGLALSCPIYAATRSKRAAIQWTLLSGLCEPLGALLTACVVGDPYRDLSEDALHMALAGVAGMMACISMIELVPSAWRQLVGANKWPLAAWALGGWFLVALTEPDHAS